MVLSSFALNLAFFLLGVIVIVLSGYIAKAFVGWEKIFFSTPTELDGFHRFLWVGIGLLLVSVAIYRTLYP